MEKLREHEIVLCDGPLVLRPLTEGDWHLLLRWNSDAEVLYYSDGDDVQAYSLEDVQGIYRGASRNAYCFMMEWEGRPVGECWLQRMNLERLLRELPGRDLRRIDLMIGEKPLWGRGIGTRAIRLLVQLGFGREGADAIFACDVADYNPRSRRAFERNGFVLHAARPQPPEMKARVTHDLILTRECYDTTKEEI